MTKDLETALARAAELLPDAPDRLARVQARRAAIRRRRRLLAAGGVAVVAAGAVLTVNLSHRDRPATLAEGPSPSPATGTLVGGSGRVVSVPGRPVRFCADIPSFENTYNPPRPPAFCDLGVDVVGVELAALANRRADKGAIEGQASLTGTVTGDVLHVVSQGPPNAGGVSLPDSKPPCPAPAGGWPRGKPTEDLDTRPLEAYQGAHPGEVVEIALLRPSANQVLAFVLTAGDPGPATRALSPAYPGRFCAFPSRWTKAQVSAAVQDPSFRLRTNQVYMSGTSLSPVGQQQLHIRATRSTPDLEAAVARHPAGLVVLDLFLHPV